MYNQKSLLSNTIWNTAGLIVYFACQWLITVAVVWLYDGYANAGYLSLALSVTNVFFLIAAYNTRTYQVLDVRGEYSDGTYIATRIVTCIIAGALCVIFVLLSGYSQEQASIILCYLAFRLVEAFIDVFHGIVQKHQRLDFVGISFMARGVLTLGIFCILGYYFDLLTAIMGMLVVSALFCLFYNVPTAKRYIDFTPPSAGQMLNLLRRCFPLMLVSLIFIFFISYARYSLERLYGTELLGAYSTAVAPAVALQILIGFMFAPLATVLSVCVKEANRARFVRALVTTSAIVAGFSLAAVIVANIAGRWGLRLLFGETILPYAYLLPSALAATGLAASLGVLNVIFIAIKDIKGLFAGSVIGVIVCIAATEMFLREYDLIGANFAQIACQSAALAVLLSRLLWRDRKGLLLAQGEAE